MMSGRLYADYQTLDTLARHCPRAISTYLQLLARSDKSGQSIFDRRLVEVDMSVSWTKFKNDIKLLAQENLLEWHPLENGGIAVQIIVEDIPEGDDEDED